MNTDLIPRKDSEFNNFQDLVIANATASAVAWGIPAGEITTGTAFQADWVARYSKVTNPATKTKATVEAKNNSRKNYEAWLRPFIQRQLILNPAVTDSDLVSMGLKPRDTVRTPVPVPATTVQLDLSAGHGNTVKVNFRQEADSDGNTRRGKPDGVTHCELAYKVDVPVPVSADDCTSRRSATRSPVLLGFTAEQAGMRLYVFARWLNSKDQPGPWTTVPASIIIPG